MPVFGPPHRPAGPRGTSGRDDCGRSRTKQRHNSDRGEPYAAGSRSWGHRPPGVVRGPARRSVPPSGVARRGSHRCGPCHRARRESGTGPAPRAPEGCMNQQLADRLRFLRAFAANPRQVGAILPDLPAGRPRHARHRRRARRRPRRRAGCGHRVPDRRDPRADGPGRAAGRARDRPAAGRRCSRSASTTRACRSCATRRRTCRTTWTASRPTSWSARCRSPRWSPGCAAASWTSLPGALGAARRGAGHPVLAADPVGAAAAVPVGPPPDLAAERAAGVPVRLLAGGRRRPPDGRAAQRRAESAAISWADSRVGARGERPLERAFLAEVGAGRATAGERGAQAGHGGSSRIHQWAAGARGTASGRPGSRRSKTSGRA